MAARQRIGIDVGGTKIAAGITDAAGQVSAWQRVPTPQDGPRILDKIVQLVETIERAAAVAGDLPVGVGVPELVDGDEHIKSSHVLDWSTEELRTALAPRRVAVEADVRAAAVAEARFGAMRGCQTGVYVSLGTGISSCLVIDGFPYRGARGFAGLIGSGQLVTRCEVCGALTHSALEEFASGAGMVERYRLDGGTATRAEDIFAAWDHPKAAAVVEDSATAVGGVLALLINVLDPQIVVVGGGLARAAEPYWRNALASARTHLWADPLEAPPIERSQLGEQVGVVGAAAVAFSLPDLA